MCPSGTFSGRFFVVFWRSTFLLILYCFTSEHLPGIFLSGEVDGLKAMIRGEGVTRTHTTWYVGCVPARGASSTLSSCDFPGFLFQCAGGKNSEDLPTIVKFCV